MLTACTLFSFLGIRWWLISPTCFMIAALALGQSFDCPYDCPNASKSNTHYSDVIMSAMASQITKPSVQAQIKESIQAPRHGTRHWFCEGNPPVTYRIQHDDVIKWKHFPRYWPFVRGIHRSPGNYPHKGQWRGALIFSLICTRVNGWVNNGEAGDSRRYRAHYDVTVMSEYLMKIWPQQNQAQRVHIWLHILYMHYSYKIE